jgi:hypothetical protein
MATPVEVKSRKSGKPETVNPAEYGQFEPIELAVLHGSAESADTDMLEKDVEPSHFPCLFRVMVMLETSGVFSIIITRDGTAKAVKANSGTALTADCGYTFDVLVHEGDSVNFQTDTAGDVTLRVQEIVGGVQ